MSSIVLINSSTCEALGELRFSSAVVKRALTAKLVAAMAISSATTLRLRDRPLDCFSLSAG